MAKSYGRQAVMLASIGRYPASLAAYQNALDIYQGIPGQESAVAYVHLYMGDVAVKAGQPCDAAAHFHTTRSIVQEKIPEWNAMLSELDKRAAIPVSAKCVQKG